MQRLQTAQGDRHHAGEHLLQQPGTEDNITSHMFAIITCLPLSHICHYHMFAIMTCLPLSHVCHYHLLIIFLSGDSRHLPALLASPPFFAAPATPRHRCVLSSLSLSPLSLSSSFSPLSLSSPLSSSSSTSPLDAAPATSKQRCQAQRLHPF